MKPNRRILFAFACLIASLLHSGLVAQKDAVAVTVARPNIAVEELSHRLLPLRKEQIQAELEAWLGLLQMKVSELTEAEIAIKSAEAESKGQRMAEISALRDQRIALADRVNAVIAAFEAKGGESADERKYISAISGLAVNVGDMGIAWQSITNWAMSSEGGLRWLKNIILFFVILIAFRILAKIAARVVARTMRTFGQTSDLLRDFFVNAVRKITMFIGIVVALSALEIDIGPLLAAIGAAGFVVGFALQGTLSNFASGVMILLYRPYDIGHAVMVAGESGSVIAMNLVSTTIRTGDNRRIVIPNSSIWGDVITNVSGNKTRRLDLIFGIGYDDDIRHATTVLEEIVKGHSLVLDDPAPLVKLHELADSSVNFIVRPWTKTEDYWEVRWDLIRAVKERFDAEGISIPYPQQDLHLHQAAPAGG